MMRNMEGAGDEGGCGECLKVHGCKVVVRRRGRRKGGRKGDAGSGGATVEEGG